MNLCSPKVNSKYKSCLTHNMLQQLAKLINKHTNQTININLPRKQLHNSINNYIVSVSSCKSETCWNDVIQLITNIPNKLAKEIQSNFKPKKPLSWKTNKNTWLNTNDINNVLNQYMESHNNFYYYGAVPDDFDLKSSNGSCKISELCKFNLKNMLNNKYECFAVVFNTDPSTKSGEHWTCMFTDIKGNNKKEPTIYYFDSVGDKPSENIEELIDTIEEQGNMENISFNHEYNDIQHQEGTTECGMYTIHFIIYMLQGNSFKKYIKNKKSDEFIEKFRNIYFI